MNEDEENSNDSDHVYEFRQRDKELDSVLNVIRTSNIDPDEICPRRIIGENDVGDKKSDSTIEFEERLAKMCNKEINGDSINFDFDILSRCCKEIINDNHGSINFDKAAVLVDSSVQVYSEKVDHLHSLASQVSKNLKKKSQPEQQTNVSEQIEEDDFWVSDVIEVDPNCTLDYTTTSLVNPVKPPADLVLEGDGLYATGDGGTLASYAIANYVPYQNFLLLDPHDTTAVDEYLKGEADFRKGQHGGNEGSSQSSKSLDERYPVDGGYPVPRNAQEDDSVHCHGDSYGYESRVPDAKIEGYLHPLLDSPLANISASEKQTELAARVSSWKQKIKQDLEEHEARPALDIDDYGKRVLHKLSQSADLENNVSFADVVQGEEKHDFARSFSALLHLANNGNIDLRRSDTNDEDFMSANHFSVGLVKHVKRRQQVQFQSSKRRAVSQTNEEEAKDKIGGSGKENCEP